MIKPASDFVSEAQKICQCIDPDAAKTLFESSSTALILDVREPQEAEESNVKGSINIPRGLLEMKIQNHCTDPDTVIVVYCALGGRASLSAARLTEMGYKNVHAITATFEAVKKAFG